MTEKKYPINEIFYSLQGEGIYAGRPANFIRLSGCNMVCSYCDTNHKPNTEMTLDEILKQLNNLNRTVVLTGGEPTVHNLEQLMTALHESNCIIHIETNGSRTKYTSTLAFADWVTLSPKGRDLSLYAIHLANEIKLLVGSDNWQEYIKWFTTKYNTVLKNTLLQLLPLADGKNLNTENIKLALDYCLLHPQFSLTLQQHKILEVK